jgi:tRNA dimethylallyltransferase
MKYVVLGPTASGKTAYAIALATRIGGAVISADSRQLYAGMNIGTAKPEGAWGNTPHGLTTPDTILGIDHYLLNVTTIDTPYTLTMWLAAAKTCIKHVEAQGKIPIIAGGTMLYIDALVDGYSIPNIEPDEAFRAELEQKSPEELYKTLKQKDPAATEFIEPHNSRRMIRALEVMHATGKRFSELRTKHAPETTWTKIGIFSDWETIKNNITKRSSEMLTQGLEQERQHLAEQFPTSPLLQTVNYKEKTLEEMIQSNMRYAHRQMSWWKRKKDIGWVCVS